MHITIDQLIEIVKESTREKDILVPSMDRFRRAGDFEESSITYIDTTLFLEELRKLRKLRKLK